MSNPYKDQEQQIRRLREISMRTGIPLILPKQETTCVEMDALSDPEHVVDPQEPTPIYQASYPAAIEGEDA